MSKVIPPKPKPDGIRKSPSYQAISNGVQHPVYVFTCEACGQHTVRRRRGACYLMLRCPVCEAVTEHA